ncbi:MAG: hypothetical protein AAF268_13400 [Cyanobacteria bacterium P01_A01_bin.3]
MSYGYDSQEEYIPTPEELAALERAQGNISILGLELTPVRMGLIIGALGLIGVFALSFFSLKPTWQKIQATEADVQAKRTQLTSAQEAIASLENIDQDINQARALNVAISALLPTPENVNTQLLEVSRLVQQSDTVLSSFVPSAPQPAGAGVPAAIQPQITQNSTQVAVNSDAYQSGIELMGNIERLETLFKVSNLNMSVDSESAIQTTQFNLDAFVYDSSIPVAVPAVQEEATQE